MSPSFALEVLRCGASALPPDVRRWLCPAVKPFTFLGYALGAAFWPNKSEGLSPNQGRSPGIIWTLSAGRSHRLTSGGKAEPTMAYDYCGKPGAFLMCVTGTRVEIGNAPIGCGAGKDQG
jgi:hypothetical protein